MKRCDFEAAESTMPELMKEIIDVLACLDRRVLLDVPTVVPLGLYLAHAAEG
jgi:hypothetical protein